MVGVIVVDLCQIDDSVVLGGGFDLLGEVLRVFIHICISCHLSGFTLIGGGADRHGTSPFEGGVLL